MSNPGKKRAWWGNTRHGQDADGVVFITHVHYNGNDVTVKHLPYSVVKGGALWKPI